MPPRDIRAYARARGLSLTADQLRVLDSVLTNRPTIVEAAHSVGKSMLAALLACWFFETHPNSIGMVTAPVSRQINEIIFKEMRRILAGSPHFAPKASSLQRAHDWWVKGLATSSGDAFQGKHSPGGILIIFDEASGIEDVFWQRAHSMFEAGRKNHYFLGISNPYTRSCPMWVESQTGRYNVLRMSALEHPNVVERREVVPGAISFSTVAERVRSECRAAEPHEADQAFEFDGGLWVPENPLFEVQILGKYPRQSDYSLWSDTDLENLRLPIRDDLSYRVAIGCDVARYGSCATVMAVRRGPNLVHVESHHGYSIVQTANRLKELANRWQTKGHSGTTVPIHIDGTGVGGGVCDLAGTGSSRYRFIEVNNAQKPSEDMDLYVPNKRTELWINLRDLARARKISVAMLPTEQQAAILAELRLPEFRIDMRGRTVLETKDKISDRLGQSPDWADAMTLAFIPERRSYESHF